MLIYNLFIFTVALFLVIDYYVDRYDVHLKYGGNRMAVGNSFIYLALGVIIFFAGFRFKIGYDYPKYFAGYIFDDELKHWEPFFNFFVRLIREFNFGLDIQAMFFFFSALTIIIVYKALRALTPYYRFGVLLYLFIPSLFVNSFSVIRQGISLGILLYGLQYITTVRPDYKKYVISAFVAFMFHYSSIFVVLVYVVGAKFFKKTHSWLLYSLILLVSFFLSFAHISKYLLLSMPGHFSTYANNFGYTVSPLKLLIVNAFFLFFMLQKDKFVKTKLDNYLLNSIFIGLLIFNIFSDFVFVSRLAQYFLAVQIIFVPIYLYSIKDTFIRNVMFVLFLVYYLSDFNYALYRDIQSQGPTVSKYSNALVPYRNYFFEEQKSTINVNKESWYNYILEMTQNNEEMQK